MKINRELSLLVMLEKSKTTSDNKAPVVIRLTVEGKRAEIFLGQKVDVNNWNQQTGCVKGTSQEARIINNAIDTAKVTLRNHYNTLKLTNDFVSSAMVKEAYKGKKEKAKGLIEVIDLAITKMEAKVEKGFRKQPTLTKLRTTKDKVAAYLEHAFKANDIPLKLLTLSFAEDFVDFLILEQNIANNTANKYFSLVRGIVDDAVARRWLISNPLLAYQCPYIQLERDVLDESEILMLYQKKMPVERLEEVKNAYLFMCFTGYAYKDASQLRPNNIVTYFDGNEWIVKNRQKITKTICSENVPLLPIAKEIIARYADNPYCKKHNLLLPIKSNQKYNAYLKEVAAICGIKKDLTTHTARHTFATTVTLANGVPLETVSALLGHKSIKTTQIYAKIVAHKVSADMQQLKLRLADKWPEIMSHSNNQ